MDDPGGPGSGPGGSGGPAPGGSGGSGGPAPGGSGGPGSGPGGSGGSGPGPGGSGGPAPGGPHPRTRRWVEEVTGGRVVRARRLPGGLTSQVHAVTVSGARAGPDPRAGAGDGPDASDGPDAGDGADTGAEGPAAEVVVREVVDSRLASAAAGMVQREAGALRRLAGTAVHAPRLLGADPAAERAGHPALLATFLAGTVRLGEEGLPERLAALARLALTVHRTPVATGDRPPPWRSWTDPAAVHPPRWAAAPELVVEAVAVLRQAAPAGEEVLLHRDLQPGNVLFSGAAVAPRVTGLVDWVETSWGPADVDLAHCRTNLAMLHGPEAADVFREHYLALGGRAEREPARRAWWDLSDALSFLPDPAEVAVPWRELGRADLVPARVRDRWEAHVAAVLRRT